MKFGLWICAALAALLSLGCPGVKGEAFSGLMQEFSKARQKLDEDSKLIQQLVELEMKIHQDSAQILLEFELPKPETEEGRAVGQLVDLLITNHQRSAQSLLEFELPMIPPDELYGESLPENTPAP